MPVFLLFAYHIATMPALLQLVYQTELVVNIYFPLKNRFIIDALFFLSIQFLGWGREVTQKCREHAGMAWLDCSSAARQGLFGYVGQCYSCCPLVNHSYCPHEGSLWCNTVVRCTSCRSAFAPVINVGGHPSPGVVQEVMRKT